MIQGGDQGAEDNEADTRLGKFEVSHLSVAAMTVAWCCHVKRLMKQWIGNFASCVGSIKPRQGCTDDTGYTHRCNPVGNKRCFPAVEDADRKSVV